MAAASILDCVSLPDIDKVIASGNHLLRFPEQLEAIFEGETGRRRCRELIHRAYIGIVVYDFFAISDWMATPDLFWTALWMRLAFFTPVALILTATLYRSPRAFVRETLMCVGAGALATGTIFFLMAKSGGSPQGTLHESMILVVLFLTVVQRIRFWYLLPACLAFLLVHAAALAMFYNYPPGEQVAIDMVFGGTVIFALVASYTMERDLRLHYLLSLRSRVQTHELDLISRRDPLTGLGNRRALEETLAECERQGGFREELTVVLLDVDHFKAFNDTAGHQAGDICLRKIARIIEDELRDPSRAAFRFGGEEFIVVLPLTDLATGVRIAERMRRAIEKAAIPHPAPTIGPVVTASFGVACSRQGNGACAAADVVAGADAALYAAKRNGRNQVSPSVRSLFGTDLAAALDATA